VDESIITGCQGHRFVQKCQVFDKYDIIFLVFRRYIEAQHALAKTHPKTQLPAITISRQTGAGAVTIGHLAAKILDDRSSGDLKVPWAVFEQNLAEKVLQEHNLPASLERFMHEDATFPLNDAVDELLGLHPSSWTLMERTTQTIRRLATMGNVILVGRFEYYRCAHAACFPCSTRRAP
jgi:hypothetical protein